MRTRHEASGISVHAISGSHVVTLGLDATDQARQGLLGFGIRRDDHAGGQARWLRGRRVFESVEPDPQPDQSFSTLRHPIQSYLWGHYTAKPGHTYTYLIRPFYGTPQDMQPGPDVSVDITVEDEDDGEHAVYFNRGAITSQAYAEQFGDSVRRTPKIGGIRRRHGYPADSWKRPSRSLTGPALVRSFVSRPMNSATSRSSMRF